MTQYVEVRSVARTDKNPMDLMNFAAKTCYMSVLPQFGAQLPDPVAQLLKSGHHTTGQHAYRTVAINGIAVGEVKNCLHLANPFYNTDERSSRFCAKMFLEPDFPRLEAYARHYWPGVGEAEIAQLMKLAREGVQIFHQNIKAAEGVAKRWLAEERPGLKSRKNSRGDGLLIDEIAGKIAQEQMRSFITMGFPTGLVYTLNMTAVVAMYLSVGMPASKDVTARMLRGFTTDHRLQEYFKTLEQREGEWAPALDPNAYPHIKFKPSSRVLSVVGDELYVSPTPEQMHPFDLLPFLPEMMNNSIGGIISEVEMSAGAMGQDQRHRTVNRGTPVYTGAFYLPPIASELGLYAEGEKLAFGFVELASYLPPSLLATFMPYGMMVRYFKHGNFNATAHEKGKRTCWCAQEEIYNMAVEERNGIIAEKGEQSPFLAIYEPPCFQTGKCGEGSRNCGRRIAERATGEYWPYRRV